MSKQLAVSAAFSIFAMAAFALLGAPDPAQVVPANDTGATFAAAPAPTWQALLPVDL